MGTDWPSMFSVKASVSFSGWNTLPSNRFNGECRMAWAPHRYSHAFRSGSPRLMGTRPDACHARGHVAYTATTTKPPRMSIWFPRGDTPAADPL
jgi:hypothetical protein